MRLGDLGERSVGRALAPKWVGAESRRQTVFVEFQAKNLSSSSNDLHELFRK